MSGTRNRSGRMHGGAGDELDAKITELLLGDARLPSSQISRELGVAEATVRYRIRRLKKQGRIFSMTIAAYEGAVRAAFLVRTEPDRTAEFVDSVGHMPNVAYLAMGSGAYDVYMYCVFQDEDEFVRFRNQAIGASEAVAAMACLQFTKIVSRSYGLSGFPAPGN